MTPAICTCLTLWLAAPTFAPDPHAGAPPPAPAGVVRITAGVTGSCPYGLVA